MTYQLDAKDLGYRHNRLDTTAKQLREDGNTAAVEYQYRAENEQAAYEHLVDLGQVVSRIATETQDRDQPRTAALAAGTRLAQYLLDSGWGPTNLLSDSGRIAEVE